MEKLAESQKEYSIYRLKEWGRWERAGNSIRNLGYECFLGKLAYAHLPGTGQAPAHDEEGYQIHRILLHLKGTEETLYELAFSYFVKGLRAKSLSKQYHKSERTIGNWLDKIYSFVFLELAKN